MNDIVTRIRQGSTLQDDAQLIESALNTCDEETLSQVASAYLKYGEVDKAEEFLRCAENSHNSGFLADVITGLSNKGNSTNCFAKLVMRCLKGIDEDFCNEAKIAALHALGDLRSFNPIDVRRHVGRAWISDDRFVRVAAYVAAQQLNGVASRDVIWEPSTASERAKADEFMKKWLADA